jgi:hypothetical protein
MVLALSAVFLVAAGGAGCGVGRGLSTAKYSTAATTPPLAMPVKNPRAQALPLPVRWAPRRLPATTSAPVPTRRAAPARF